MYPHDTIMDVYDTIYEQYVLNKHNLTMDQGIIVKSILNDIMIMYQESLESFDRDMDALYGGTD